MNGVTGLPQVAQSDSDSIVITRNGSQASIKGLDDWFTGPVRVPFGTFIPWARHW